MSHLIASIEITQTAAVKSQELFDKEQQLRVEREKKDKRDAVIKLKMQQRAEVRCTRSKTNTIFEDF